jgi:hypothetical protein
MAKLKLGIIEFKSNVGGVDLKLPTELSLQIETEVDKVTILSEALIDLGELQANFLTIVRSNPLPPRPNDYGLVVEFKSIDSATLIASGDTAILETGLSFGVWEIAKGIPTWVPRYKQVCVVPWPGERWCTDVLDGGEWRNGSDIIIKLFDEGASAKVKFGLTTPDGKSINIQEFDAEVSPRGDLGKFVAKILELVRVNINTIAKNKIQDIINEGTLKQTLPKNLDNYNPVIKTIQFTTIASGNLGVFVSFEASITEEQLTEIISKTIG